MSGVQPSAHDSGIVENVLGIGIGLVMVGVGIYAWLNQSEILIVLFSGGIGLVIVVGAAIQTRKTVQNLVEAGVTDPVEVLRADLNDRDEIIKGLLKVVLFWGSSGDSGRSPSRRQTKQRRGSRRWRRTAQN